MRLRPFGALAACFALTVACGARTELASPDSRQCDWTAPFGAVHEFSELRIPKEQGHNQAAMRLSGDELTAYFERGGDIFVTHRASIGAPFDTPRIVSEVSSTAYDDGPFIAPDGLALYLSSNPSGGVWSDDLYVARRASVGEPFSAPALISNVDSHASEGDPFVTSDGNELWFSTDRDEGSADLYRAVLGPTGFDAPQPVTELDTSDAERSPVLSADGLVVYFARTGAHGTKVYVAHRTSVASTFSTPSEVPEIAAPQGAAPSWISFDQCRLYFTGALTSPEPNRFYVATRQ